MEKYVFVTGGVCSSLGKGIAAASLGSLLEARGYTVGMIKVDPYINVDAGTMSPYQHGEVYVTDDGAETDLDLGNYARFTKSPLSRSNSITTGQIYQEVIQREREGRYLGRTVQVIPHITDQIKHRLLTVGQAAGLDVIIVEVGGTVGDIESIPFLEAARQMIMDIGREHVISIHLTLIPEVGAGELKTKPTQHSVTKMRELGIQPDVLLCRAPRLLDDDLRKKIASLTNVPMDSVMSAPDVAHTIYEVPIIYADQSFDVVILKRLGLPERQSNLDQWRQTIDRFVAASQTVRIAMVGKYIELADSYKSVDEALLHAGIANGVKVELVKLDSEQIESPEQTAAALQGVDGILVPGGFGARGVRGMIYAARHARQQKIPYFGICLGMQVMVIEYARNRLDWPNADSSEFNPEGQQSVISLLEDQVDIKIYGGSMRLGLMSSLLKTGTLIQAAYGTTSIQERHRHRYEVSNKYRADLEKAGLIVAATTLNGELVEAVEWPNHPWGLGVQYHPEFKSTPLNSHPLFRDFVKAAKAN